MHSWLFFLLLAGSNVVNLQQGAHPRISGGIGVRHGKKWLSREQQSCDIYKMGQNITKVTIDYPYMQLYSS